MDWWMWHSQILRYYVIGVLRYVSIDMGQLRLEKLTAMSLLWEWYFTQWILLQTKWANRLSLFSVLQLISTLDYFSESRILHNLVMQVSPDIQMYTNVLIVKRSTCRKWAFKLTKFHRENKDSKRRKRCSNRRTRITQQLEKIRMTSKRKRRRKKRSQILTLKSRMPS